MIVAALLFTVLLHTSVKLHSRHITMLYTMLPLLLEYQHVFFNHTLEELCHIWCSQYKHQNREAAGILPSVLKEQLAIYNKYLT